MLLAGACPVCSAAGPAPCPACRARLRGVGRLRPPDSLDSCAAVLEYEGAGRRLVTSLKYSNDRRAVAWLGRAMAHVQQGDQPVAVTWAPTSRSRRRRRGFDQARLLASAVARELHLPLRRLLRRVDPGSQTGRGRVERLGAAHFVAVRRCPGALLLVDDVLTTGSTLAAAAAACRAGGATEVHGVVAARTPLKSGAVGAEGCVNGGRSVRSALPASTAEGPGDRATD